MSAMIGRASLPSLFWWHYQSTYHFLFAKKGQLYFISFSADSGTNEGDPSRVDRGYPSPISWRPILSRPLGPSAAHPAAAQSVSRSL